MNILLRREKCQIFRFLPLPTDPGSAKYLTAPSATKKFFEPNQNCFYYSPSKSFQSPEFQEKYFF